MDTAQQVNGVSAEAMHVSLCLRDEEAGALPSLAIDIYGLSPYAWCRGSRREVLAMGMWLRRRDPVVSRPPAVPASRATRGRSIARIARTAWWPRFLVAGLVLAVVGVTLLSGVAQALVILGGVAVFVFAAAQGLLGRSWDRDRRREPPVPPGSGSPIF